jgi:SAM-dependent methyltransferase
MKDISIERHNAEIQENLKNWAKKTILHTIYKEFYQLIGKQIDYSVKGPIVELGSGIGNIKLEIPDAICTDLFENPWIDQVENAYKLSFDDSSISNLILFDVFHHIQYPGTALAEFHRVLKPDGRVVIFDPSISFTGLIVYGLFHHEPVALMKKIQWSSPAEFNPWLVHYYAAQGNAERIFFTDKYSNKLQDWSIIIKHKYSALVYILSGGYSKPQLFSSKHYNILKQVEKAMDRFPGLFGTRSLIVLKKK